MVDETRVLRLLRAVTDDLAVLDAKTSANDSRRADPLWLRGIEYTFVTAIEACVDGAQHLCATSGWGPPRDNVDDSIVHARLADPATLTAYIQDVAGWLDAARERRPPS